MSMANGLSILFILSKNQLLALLIFAMVSFVSFAFIPALIFKISFLLQAYLKKQEKSQINNLTLHLKQLEKEEMKNPRVSRRKERKHYFIL